MTEINLFLGAPAGSETLPISRNMRSLRIMELRVGIFSILLVTLSILLFLMDATCKRLSKLINEQNAAAIKLGLNLDYYESFPNHAPLLLPGLIEDTIEFSRGNAIIIEIAYRMSPTKLFSTVPVLDLLTTLRASDGSNMPFTHISIDPAKHTADQIVGEGHYQIQLFQAIRDRAHDLSSFWHGVIAGISAYLLPFVYAVLGAFLYEFRTWCMNPSKTKLENSPDRTSRLLMAGIAGIVIGAFNDLFPKEILLPPLPIAFVVGYSIDVFTARLDALKHDLKGELPPSGFGGQIDRRAVVPFRQIDKLPANSRPSGEALRLAKLTG
jgi:hypothetical protein